MHQGRKFNGDFKTVEQLHLILRLIGGKGGFGSMLRAIGAQIEKTTNREACRDLSGRRLRDINEEKRIKTYLEKRLDQEDPEEKFQKKIGKLLAKPKREFQDEEYDAARTDLTQNIDEALEMGIRKAKQAKLEETVISSTSTSTAAASTVTSTTSKRKSSDEEAQTDTKKKKKKPATKGALW